MDKKQFLEDIVKIHSVSVATIDSNNKPSIRIIDMMYLENDCIYFLTARGKNFYQEIIKDNYIALSCQKYNKSYVVKGYVEQVDHKYLDVLFNHNKYMWGTYPRNTRDVLEVFRIYKWSGEYFDVTSKPITRLSFSHNMEEIKKGTFIVNNDKCISCKKCITVCPQKCIDYSTGKAYIKNKHCLRCGACKEVCPANAIEQI